MADLVILVVPGLGVLALAPDALRAALARGRVLLGEPATGAPAAVETVPNLVSAEELERRSGVPANWWMARARERRVPFRKIGRRVRFDPAEALGCEAFARKAIPSGVIGFHNRNGGASD
jgi:hypothetical protein